VPGGALRVVIYGHIKPPVIPPATALTKLTDHQIAVAKLLAEGLRPKEIAATLKRGEPTIRHHIKHIYAALGIDSAVVLTRWAVACGLVAAVPRG
jgi:DNA-binding NarL/FixJ family response regulator